MRYKDLKVLIQGTQAVHEQSPESGQAEEYMEQGQG